MKPLALAAALAATAAAGTAHADDDEPRPVAPLGWRFGIGGLPLDGEKRFAGNLGVTRGFTIGETRVSAEYAIGLLSAAGSDDTPMVPPARGTAHRGTGVARVGLWKRPWGTDSRLYLDGELGAELVLAFDSRAGRVLAPNAVAGLRFGCEMFGRRSLDSPSRIMDGLFTFRFHADRLAVGAIFSMGMDFGR
jgi:hypothetical protein